MSLKKNLAPPLLLLPLWLYLLLNLACGNPDGSCIDGECDCPTGASCEFSCEQPPCNVDCRGKNDACSGDCAQGECYCGAESFCQFECSRPPCEVDCNASSCSGECANGSCTCSANASCDFQCNASPCQLSCIENNPACTGQCAGGSCTCGINSNCDFQCLDDNCTFNCEAGAKCLIHCAEGKAGQPECRFSICEATSEKICPDGKTVACGRPCPQEN